MEFRRILGGLILPLGLGVVVAGCSGGSSGSSGQPPPNTSSNTNAGPTSSSSNTNSNTNTSSQVGSNFWYVNDTFGNPLKSHNSNEQSLADEVLVLVNQERATLGLDPLIFDAEAQTVAKAHAEDMVGRNYFSHYSPEGWEPVRRMFMITGDSHSTVSENIAVGQQTAAAVVASWMASPGHSDNILTGTHTHLGVGVADSQGPHWVQVFVRRP